MMAKFYNRLAANASADPVLALHQVQSSAARATRINLQSPATGLVGGIGSGSPSISPSIWSGFSLYSRI
jgi:hypothetical protein